MFRKVMISAACLVTATGAANAQGVRSFNDYARVAGETFEARTACNAQVDTRVLLEIGKPFRMSGPTAAIEEAAMKAVVEAQSAAYKRRQSLGEAAFCKEMVLNYGPQGKVAAGLLK